MSRSLVDGGLPFSTPCISARDAAARGMLRFVPVLCIARVFSIVVARLARTHGGQAIGVGIAVRIGVSLVAPHVPAVPR